MNVDIKEVWPLLTGAAGSVGGVLATVWKYTQSIKKKIETLQRENEELRRKALEDRRAFGNFTSTLRIELNDKYEELDAKFTDHSRRIDQSKERLDKSGSNRTTLEDVKRRLARVEEEIEDARADLAQCVKSETFHNFSQEYQEQCRKTERNLGEIEGILRRL